MNRQVVWNGPCSTLFRPPAILQELEIRTVEMRGLACLFVGNPGWISLLHVPL